MRLHPMHMEDALAEALFKPMKLDNTSLAAPNGWRAKYIGLIFADSSLI